MKKALLISLGFIFIFCGCGSQQKDEKVVVQPHYRAAEPTKEEIAEAEKIRKSIEDYQRNQEKKAEKLLHKDDILKPSIEQTLFSDDLKGVPITREEIELEMYYDSLEELAVCVMAEAGNQGIDGMRMVADVILNRVDDPDFPNTIHDVISQPFHFSSYWDGGMKRWSVPSEDCYKAVQMEIRQRSYPGILFFQTGCYSKYGTPAFKHMEHYFSTR